MRVECSELGIPEHPETANAVTAPAAAKLSAGAVPLAPGLVEESVVQQALTQVISSGKLRGAIQLRRFLAFVVEESLSGRGDKLKAYTIATRALGRPSDFDPGKDPIVRVEATRLRAALTAYYADEGRDMPLRFHMIPGSYRPLIELRDVPSIAVTEPTPQLLPVAEPISVVEVPAAAPAAATPAAAAASAIMAMATEPQAQRLVMWIALAALVSSVATAGLAGYGIYLLNEHLAASDMPTISLNPVAGQSADATR